MLTNACTIFSLVLLSVLVEGDVYMHTPAGSNNRNRENNDNRNNANRLFDSQNNGNGGYAWHGDDMKIDGMPDALTYYSGMDITVQWTSQHACNDVSTHCSTVLQYTCDDISPGLRDGYPVPPANAATKYQKQPGNNNQEPEYLEAKFNQGNSGQNQDGTKQIEEDATKSGCGTSGTNKGYEKVTGGVGSQRDSCDPCPNREAPCEYGQHEDYWYYQKTCQTVERNKGLFVADRKLNRQNRRSTRQNPNGNRRGLECPEERDYYPWWGQTQWVDIAVMTSQAGWCDYYKAESQNTKARWYCDWPSATSTNPAPITKEKCDEKTGAAWRQYKSWNQVEGYESVQAPACYQQAHTTQNHLGYNEYGTFNNFTFRIPEITGKKQCVFRLRYNISTDDYKSMAGYGDFGDDFLNGKIVDATYNCGKDNNQPANYVDPETNPECDAANAQDCPQTPSVAGSCLNDLTNNNRPLNNRPELVYFGVDESSISHALNTDQSGRTFQDRSYVFYMASRDEMVQDFKTKQGIDIPRDAKVHHMGTMGRRGNIVQAYPSQEYRFSQASYFVNHNDYMLFQFHGSDHSPNRNPNNAEGQQNSDRHNMLEMNSANHNFGAEHVKFSQNEYTEEERFFSQKDAIMMALLGQKQRLIDGVWANVNDANQGKAKVRTYRCIDEDAAAGNKDNHPLLCGKMNAAPQRFEYMVQAKKVGTSKFVSTRNNNFSNRAQKTEITVGQEQIDSASTAGAVIGSIIAVGAVAFGVVCLLAFLGVISIPFIKPMKKKAIGDKKESLKSMQYNTKHTRDTVQGLTGEKKTTSV